MVHNSDSSEARRRGRPRSFDEGEVLEKARNLFWDFGYAATSLDDLAAATGLNRPSLYAAFGDKHALYMRALEESRTSAVEGIRQRLAAATPLRESLLNFFTEAAANTLLGDSGARGCFMVCTAVTESVRDPDTRAVVAAYVAEVDALFRERFSRSHTELRSDVDPAAAAAVASAMLQTLAIRARTGASRQDLAHIVQSAVDLICGPVGTAGKLNCGVA